MKKPQSQPVKLKVDHAEIGPDSAVLDITMRNSGERTILVVTDLRRITWDLANSVVTFWLSDEQPPNMPSGEGTHCPMLSVPATAAIEPGESTVVRVSMPTEFFRLSPRQGDEPLIEAISLADIQDVNVRVTIAETPFYFNPKGPPMHEQLASWGQVAVTRVKRDKIRRPGDTSEVP